MTYTNDEEFIDISEVHNKVIIDKNPDLELMEDYNSNCDDDIDYEDMEEDE